MARKKRPEEHENHERWLVSYADFITLLFAFFVVMYSISSVNEGKYRVLSDAIVAAFRASAKALEPIQVGESAKVKKQNSPIPIPMKNDSLKNSLAPGSALQQGEITERERGRLADIKGQIEKAMAPLIEKELISVNQGKNFLEVEINSNILFPSGSSILSDEARSVLRLLADVLSPEPNPIHVEGYTDNIPISNVIYPSNWELSAARAASVVHLFSDRQVLPTRMVAIGFGEFRPVADNATPQGRQKNRRVRIVVLGRAQDEGRFNEEIELRTGGDFVAPAEPSVAATNSDQLPPVVMRNLPPEVAEELTPQIIRELMPSVAQELQGTPAGPPATGGPEVDVVTTPPNGGRGGAPITPIRPIQLPQVAPRQSGDNR